MMMRNYAFYSLNMYSKITIEYLVETIAFTIENFVFAYLGLCISLYMEKSNLMHLGFGMLAFIISRPLSVFIMTFFVNYFKKKSIPFSHQVILSYSGIRGAVAFYLVLSMTILSEEYEYGKKSEIHKRINMTTVMTIIAFTVIVLGGSSRWLMDYLNSKYPEDKIYVDPLEFVDSEEEKSVDFEVKGFYHDDGDDKSVGVITRVENFDEQVLQKLLRKYNYDDTDMIEPFELYKDGENLNIDDISITDAQKRNKRQSITYEKSIPLRPVKVQFSLPVEDPNKPQDKKFLSPDPKFQRRSTILNNKMNSAMLSRYSLMKPEQAIGNGIDYSISRRKSVLAVKKIAERNERLSISLKSQRDRKQTIMYSDKRRTLNNLDQPSNTKSPYGGSHTDRYQDRSNTPFSMMKARETEVVLEANEDNEDEEDGTYGRKFNNYTMKVKEESKFKPKDDKKERIF